MQSSFIERHKVLFSAAVLAAHASAGSERFRQRDVKFLVELFANWLSGPALEVNNTQVLRYLESLLSEALITKKPNITYRLTRAGLLEVSKRLTSESQRSSFSEFFFLIYFISSYKTKIQDLVVQEGKRFPVSIKLELEDILDERSMIDDEIRRTKLKIQKLDARIKEAHGSGVLARRLLKSKNSIEDIASEINKEYPFALNNIKPLGELAAKVPRDIFCWEISYGNDKRAATIWSSTREVTRSYLSRLQSLKNEL